ncbi:hypothetical protein ACFLTS_04970 [Chloroflexota bacterium]
MSSEDEKIKYAIKHTEVLRHPKQTLSTFGTTNIHYYILTEPSYTELVGETRETKDTVVREGRVIAERPRVVTPSYLVNIEGFSEHARRYMEMTMSEQGPHAPGLFYSYKNEPGELTIASSDLDSVVLKLTEKLDKEDSSLAAIIKGIDDLWDVSLLKFIFEMTKSSLGSNIFEMGRRGLLDVDQFGVPRDARVAIERLFDQVIKGDMNPSDLKMELDRWGLFAEYEDRFLRLFKR